MLDLDETLVHSTFQPTPNADLVVPVHLGQGVFQPIYVCKRPGVDEFLRHVVMHFEVVIFTASLSNVHLYSPPHHSLIDSMPIQLSISWTPRATFVSDSTERRACNSRECTSKT